MSGRPSSWPAAAGRRGQRVLMFLALLLALSGLQAHEVRPAYLELRERVAGEYEVLWKTPMAGDLRLALTPEFSGTTRTLTPVVTRTPPGAAIAQWTLAAPQLRGQGLNIDGLESTLTDVLVRIEFLDGSEWTQRLTARNPGAEIPLQPSLLGVAGVYGRLGIEHILTGADHLLFVLALLFLVQGGWRLVQTVTAFTVAHSLTLALATLGALKLPPPLVEALIALSIAFVGAEILRRPSAVAERPAASASLAARAPWLMALVFGLLHGLGFAGALSEIGLPQGRVALALLMFNLGVEAGQLLFVAAVLATWQLLRRLPLSLPGWSLRIPPYTIGIVGMFWLCQRVAAF